MTKTLQGPQGIKLILDKSQVFPDDPGAGTPAMVELKKASSTYWCAINEGELLTHNEPVTLSSKQLQWLHELEDFVNDYLFR
jgi:hypothetical protein